MLRIGALSTSWIVPIALVQPARAVNEVSLVAVAARDPARAQAFAAKHSIPKVHENYDALIADPEIDAVYIPLPNGLHGEWAIKAVNAGKHVLCEKPVAANAEEAGEMASAAKANGRLIMEAVHYRYHPLAQRIADIVTSGELGEIREIRAAMCFPLPLFNSNRYRFETAGGAMMDFGCYVVHLLRLIGGPEPEVVSATAKLRGADIDRAMEAELRFKSGAKGLLSVSMWSAKVLDGSLTVTGSAGKIRANGVLQAQMGQSLTIESASGRRKENLGKRPSYLYQLEAFAAACLRGAPVLTPVEDGILNMSVIDAIYRAAGLPVRRPASAFR